MGVASRHRCLLVAGLVSFSQTLATAQDTGDAAKGRAFAQANCSQCHAVLTSQTFPPRAGVASFKAIANTPGMTALALTVWFRTSHPTMPNLVLNPDDRDDVIAYIRSLRD